jgi:twitching motility two-component system response regulator PilH
MKTILIVEFHNRTREILMRAIQSDHLTVITTDNGADALAIINNQPPNLIITEIILPKINGFQLCRQLASNELMVNIPIIILTSFDDEFTAYWSRRGCPNVKDFIPKNNSNIGRLLEAINSLIG